MPKIICLACGAENTIRSATPFTFVNYTKEGSCGTQPCDHCGRDMVWTGDMLVPLKLRTEVIEEPKVIEEKEVGEDERETI